LKLNAYHFGAANIMGHCYLKLGDPISALASFRKGLSLNPNQEALRFQVRKLERALEGRG
jgi:tetratricopeptide (TPR) repeat protein